MHQLSKRLARPVVLTLVLAALAGVALWFFGRKPEAHNDRIIVFHESASESGIDFRMSFLPLEQGENFKVNLYDHGSGLAVADYDGDGLDDVLFLNQLGPNALYRNTGGGRFENVTERAGPIALSDRVCVAAAFGDYDNDGDQDVYITSTRGGNVLFENREWGRFVDVTEQAGVACVAHSQTPSFFDYDNDGDLDLFITNTARWTTDEFDQQGMYYRGANDLWSHIGAPEDREPNVLFRNNANGTFTDVSEVSGLKGKGWSGDVAVFDFDDDGDQDLFVTNMFGLCQLYENDGNGHFVDMTRQSLGRTSFGAIGCKAFDYDNDGRFDLFIADMHSDMWLPAYQRKMIDPKKQFGKMLNRKVDADPRFKQQMINFADRYGLDIEHVLFGNSLFHNEGAGNFQEVSDAAGMETFWPWGVAVGDFDNDCYQDLFVPSGMGYPYFYYPSSLMMNNGDGTFIDRAEGSGIEPPADGQFLAESIAGMKAARSSRCAATSDFDGDGRLDVMVGNFNDRPYYFKNRGPPRHYLALRLIGIESNRDAIGAVVKLHIADRVLVRQVQASGGYLSQSSKTVHFGLGDHDRLTRVEIRWPCGVKQTLESPEIDQLHDVVEPARQETTNGGKQRKPT